ncbi:MAG: hypothetical protein RIA69_06775 [Cyclobacteriaceae bacterium]
MEVYKDLNGDSNVEAYETGNNFISVKFKGSRKTYTYSYQKAGKYHVEQMKVLAIKGDGLNGYINSNVKFLYD